VAASAAGAAPEKGTLSFIDNGVDPRTGTIRLKATFENKGRRLWPGQFVNVAMIIGTVENGMVVPARAIQTGQSGQFVYVVSAGKTAELRPVRVALSRDAEAVVTDGLAAGETVVVDGQLLLVPGAPVEVKQEDAPGKPGDKPGGQAAAGTKEDTRS
jgi:multidrug efflux system membrane fusion protein